MFKAPKRKRPAVIKRTDDSDDENQEEVQNANSTSTQDAINATKAAVEEGIVPGGGSTLTHISNDLLEWAKDNLEEDELIGALIVEKSLTYPLRRIIENTGKTAPIIIEEIKQSDFSIGYDAALGEITDLYERGIIDPAKVTRSGLQNASSIASMILTTECIVVDNNETP